MCPKTNSNYGQSFIKFAEEMIVNSPHLKPELNYFRSLHLRQAISKGKLNSEVLKSYDNSRTGEECASAL